KYFTNTPTRIEGIGIYEIEKEIQNKHRKAYTQDNNYAKLDLEIGGDYRWRRNGERHMFNPTTVAKLQQAVRSNKFSSYKQYAQMINEQDRKSTRLNSSHVKISYAVFCLK